MNIEEEDRKEDKEAASDRGESVTLMEPLLISESSPKRGEVTDLAVEVAAKSAGFRRSRTVLTCSTFPAGDCTRTTTVCGIHSESGIW